jgi:acyl-CoA reductase-like NAD-dependent aldehyde dehydrogenase
LEKRLYPELCIGLIQKQMNYCAASRKKEIKFASSPATTTVAVDCAVRTSHEASQGHRQTTPRRRAELLACWHQLIATTMRDIAMVLVYETGKAMADALGEVDYALGSHGEVRRRGRGR